MIGLRLAARNATLWRSEVSAEKIR